MDPRDAKTKFAHQKALHGERPGLTPELLQQLRTGGRIIEAKSFNIAAKQSEMMVVFLGFDGEPVGLRLNPDIVLNLGINLLEAGAKLGWFKATLENIDPPRPH